ncbi:hypothetical protein M3697_17505 [Janibacter melonis]|uniref:hypothetical protein n=1 Tax=Janibacter melonis TaxID=262209 RepID=UPI0020448178|nr:hypothetical protein [Janibacter melonis]MCM3556878.1 hypothetical protein [Janibacter melonis]
MSAEVWANIIAVLALIGSAVGFWLNRREIKTVRDAAAEVRWGLSRTGGDGDGLLLTNLGTDTAYDVEVKCENAVLLDFDRGDIKGRSARLVSPVTAWGRGPLFLEVSWSAAPGGERTIWRHPFTTTTRESQ